MSNSIVLILGFGPGIGAEVAKVFAIHGYKVAAAARRLDDRRVDEKRLDIKLDVAEPPNVPIAFQKVQEVFGQPPSVVIYNAAIRTLLPDDDPLSSLTTDEYQRDLAVNLNSAVFAAQEAVRGFDTLPEDASRTFIYTGNKLNVMSYPKAFTFGIARAGAAHFIWDCSIAYKSKGYKFYFTDERLESGAPAREQMDPKARAEIYFSLSTSRKQLPWHYTFVKGRGYVDFRSIDEAWKVE